MPALESDTGRPPWRRCGIRQVSTGVRGAAGPPATKNAQSAYPRRYLEIPITADRGSKYHGQPEMHEFNFYIASNQRLFIVFHRAIK